MNIITIGGSTQDMCVYYQDQKIECLDTTEGRQRFLLMPEGSKIELESVVYFPGGGANNTAVAYARQGFSTTIISCIGADCQGTFVYENLIQQGVATNHLVRTSSEPTGFSIIIRLATGDRTVLTSRGANLLLSLQQVKPTALVGADQLYITSLTGTTAALLPALALQARQLGIPVAANPGTSQLCAGAHYLQEALSSLDSLILNSDEALLFMKSVSQESTCYAFKKPKQQYAYLPLLLRPDSCLDIRFFCSYIHAKGPKIVVVTNGAEGVYVATESCFYFYPSKPCKVVSTLGAGDAFGSGFIGHLLRSGSVEKAILYGMANSHSVIAHYGAQTGLLSEHELHESVSAFDATLLQSYT